MGDKEVKGNKGDRGHKGVKGERGVKGNRGQVERGTQREIRKIEIQVYTILWKFLIYSVIPYMRNQPSKPLKIMTSHLCQHQKK